MKEKINICLVGSLIPQIEYDDLVKNSKNKPSNAPENFQLCFAKGMDENQQMLDVISFPAVASYPNGPCFFWRRKQYNQSDYVHIRCPSFFNVPILKQAGIYIQTYLHIKKWLKEKKSEKNFVIVYSDYPPYASASRLACRGKKAQCIIVVADLATFSYYPHEKSLKTAIRLYLEKNSVANYRKYDGYILLSKYMESAMNIQDLPSVVMEGFSDINAFRFNEKKTDRKVFMYAGSMSRVYNTNILIEAIQKTDMDADFWFFGGGELEDIVKEASQKDPRIIFYGKVPRDELLHAEKKANILLNFKSSTVEHTKYAFPSKLLEYMASGTAVLTAKVPGIPEEYYPYFMTFPDETVDGLAATLESAAQISEQQLLDLGRSAYLFVAEKKNCRIQAEKVIRFLASL